jgi:hypothetical protein
MQRGDRDPVPRGPVAGLQGAVNARLRLEEDGIYGAKTEGAVRLLQQWAGLPATGVADEATLRHLGLSATPAPPAPPPSGPAHWQDTLIPASAKLLAALDYSGGDLSDWPVLQTRDRNGPPGRYATYSASVRDGGPGHETAARFEVRPGDVPHFGGGERAEVQHGPPLYVRAGEETFYGWSMCLGDPGTREFPPPAGWGLIVMQWHSREGSPPLSVHVDRDLRISLENDRPGGYAHPVCPGDPGTWHDYLLHVKWAPDRTGLVELWQDGTRVAHYNAATTVGGEANYLKAGIYRDRQAGTHVVWHDALRVYAA